MSTTIKLRRSAVPGRVPTTSQLELGEIAINTADGKLYFKRYDPVANTESIVDVSADLDAAAILSLLSGVDGAGSGLDADLLDGQHGSYYLNWSNFTNTATGVVAGTYGSASEVPVLEIDADGRITSANTVSVAGVSNTYWTVANNTYTIETADGGIFNTVIDSFNDISANNITTTGLVNGRDIAADGAKLDLLEDGLELTLTGKVTGTASSNTGVMTLVTELANTGVTAGSYGSSTAIPVITVDEDGRITLASTASVSGVENLTWTSANNTLSLETGDGTIYNIVLDTFNDIETNDITANNIIVNGLVDGRDIAADGAKLDLLEDGLDLTLTGKVTGTASSNTGVMTLTTELSNTGVTPGVYGSSTAIPVFTVDEDGRLTTANTTPVAGVDDFSYSAANNTITLQTGDGSVFNIQTETTVALTGKVTGSATSSSGTLSISAELSNTGVTAGSYGSSTAIPVLTIDEDGRITLASTASVAGVSDFYWTSSNNTLILETGDGSSFLVPIDTFTDITVNDLTANNIIVSGLVDGRDIAADGSKLDGIEAGATGDQTASEILSLLLTVDGDGSGLDADSVDGYSASEILDAAANNAAALVGAGEVFIYANTGVTVTGDFTFNLNSSNTHTIVIEHADTSAITDVNNSGGTVIQDLTFDNFGHVQTVGSYDLDNRYYTEAELDAGQLNTLYYTETELDNGQLDNRYYTETELNAGQLNNLYYTETELNNGALDIRYYTETELNNGQLDNRYYTETELNAGQLNNLYYTETELDNGQLDNRYYTETELDNGQLDNRYYTETESDARFVNVTGDTMTGELIVNANISQQHSTLVSSSSTTTTTSQTPVYAFPYGSYAGGEVIITATRGSNRHITKLLITHDGSTAIATEYGTVYTGSELASYDITISGPVLQILATPSASTSTTFKIVGTLIKV